MTQKDAPSPLMLFRPLALLVGAVTTAAVVLWLVMPAADTRKARLGLVDSWTYQLQNLAQSRAAIAKSDSDMLVIDYAIDRGDGLKPLGRKFVEHLKRKPDGDKRLVIAYFSVGEAEEYRPYWQAAWQEAPPDWIIAENCRWPKNHLVRFWDEGWRDIIFSGADSYLKAIQDAGFDGVYLDRVDVYADIADRHPGARAHMVAFVKDLAQRARQRDPGFLIIVQNAEELLADEAYRATIDAVAKEDLLYGVNGTGKRNPDAMVKGSVEMLDLLRAEDKPIFAVEYLQSADAIASAGKELRAKGYIGVFPTRALDGAAPVASREAAVGDGAAVTPSEAETGTPEYAQAKCDGVWKRGALKPRDARTVPENAAPDLPGASSAVQ